MMSEEWQYKFLARVITPVNGGYTKVSFELANAQREVEISTEVIPAHLRQIGSRFLLIFEWMSPANRARRAAGEKIDATYSVEEVALDDRQS
jgi:hypothetical protein